MGVILIDMLLGALAVLFVQVFWRAVDEHFRSIAKAVCVHEMSLHEQLYHKP